MLNHFMWTGNWSGVVGRVELPRSICSSPTCCHCVHGTACLFTCRRETILLASCMSFSSCSWWASSCSSQDFSSSFTSGPKEGHSPQSDTSSGTKHESCLGRCSGASRSTRRMCSRPTCDTRRLCQRRRVIRSGLLVLGLMGGRFFLGRVGGLGDNILLFGGVRRAG